MTFYKGIGGFIAAGGFVDGSPLVNGALAATATTMNIDSLGTLVGVIAPGDTFTLAGETGSPVHTVTNTGFLSITGNAQTGITFTPAIASGGVADEAAVTFTSNVVAQARDWSLNAAVKELDSSVLGSTWATFVPELASWSGNLTMFLDYNLTTQKGLINALTGATPTGIAACLFLGVDTTGTGAKGFFGAAVLNGGQVQDQLGKIVDIKVSFKGNGQLTTNWQ